MTTTPESDQPNSAHSNTDHSNAEQANTTPTPGAEGNPSAPGPSAPYPADGPASPRTHTRDTQEFFRPQPGAQAPQTRPEDASLVAPEAAAYAPQASHEPQSQSAHPKSRSGALVSGLAIGALLGGLVGGGVASLVSSNSGGQPVVQGEGGTLTLQNPETATAISGVAAVATPSVVTVNVASDSAAGSGSGVIYSEDGYIITNAHVATLDGQSTEGADIRVKLNDGRVLPGELVGTDPYADLAVVKVDGEDLPAIEIADSSELNVGDLTVAIGAPLNLSNTVTSGVVSALYRGISVGSPLIPQEPQPDGPAPDDEGDGFPWDFRFDNPEHDDSEAPQAGGSVTLPVIQTDASINPGNSGGALLNGEGELIGINVAIATSGGTPETAGSVGLGFAIPANLAERVVDSVIAGEQPSHGLLGASVGDSFVDADASVGHVGGLVVDIVPDGAAEEAGLRSGDVITAVDGVPVEDGTSVSALVRMHEGDSEVEIDYTRDGEAETTTATLDTLEW